MSMPLSSWSAQAFRGAFQKALTNVFRPRGVSTLRRRSRRPAQQISLESLELRQMLSVNTVTTTADSGAGSLRQAILDANATSANDEIVFAASLFTNGVGTITLASGLPTIAATSVAGSLSITGPGASSLTIHANQGNFSIFSIATAGNLTISGVTATGAKLSGNGGAFNNSGTLNLSSSTISGNSSAANNAGGGISNSNSGTVTVSNSTINNNSAFLGGGISNDGSLTLTNSTLSGNTGTYGGGIYNRGTLTVSNSTIDNSTSDYYGGGIFNRGTLTVSNSTLYKNSGYYGGGILNRGTLTISNSTLYKNSGYFGGGIFNTSSGTLTITNSTLSGNTATSSGGGIANYGTLNIANTIIANSPRGEDYVGSNNAIVNVTFPSTAANNLVSQGTFAWATTKTSAEINLGALANNGGPTQTLALLTGSVAIATGNASIGNAAPVNGLDQRGYARSSTTPSIGAFENPANRPTINSAATLSGGKTGAPYVMTYATLRAALNVANGVSIVVQSVQSGRVQKWSGTNWVTVSTAANAPLTQRTVSVGDKIRWLPSAGASGSRPAFKARAWDGSQYSAATAQVTIKLPVFWFRK
jgi:hypothetical protein